jgi:ABC-type sugar transport system ATPase subunit
VAGVTLAGVRKDYGEITALRDLDLDAADGELLVLLGPSGSGKSTVLRVVAGLEDATAGSVAIGGRDVTQVPPGSRNVAMVFQNYALFPHLDVAANIGFGLAARGLARREVAERVAEAARLAGCEGFLDRKPFRLSGGERQRVAIARSLAVNPKILVCDEPVSALDVSIQAQILNLFKRLQQELGLSYLFITHDLAVVRQVADRIYVLYLGEIVEQGLAEDVIARPKHPYTQRLINSIPH